MTADRNDIEPGTEVHITARLMEGTKGDLKNVLFVPVGDGTTIRRDRYTLSPDGLGMTVRIPDDFIGEVRFGAVGFVDGEPAVSNIVTIISRFGIKGADEKQ